MHGPIATDRRGIRLSAGLAPGARCAEDIANRPELDKLGPYRWHPPVRVLDWPEKVDGSSVSLADYKGKPVIVLFYLGYRCLHCIQQLHAFDPAAKEFAKAGISLVAISSDSPDELKKSCDAAKGDGEFPFPLLSDSSLKIFKTYHAYDDSRRRRCMRSS